MKLCKIFIIMQIVIYSSLFAAEPSPDAAMTGFQFLEEPTSPELIGLGYTGVASGGMGGFFYNPAKYSLMMSPSFQLEFGRYNKADANKVNFELSIPVKKSFISYGMRVFSIDGIEKVDDFGGLPYGSFSERGLKLSLGTGFELNKYLDFGISVSGITHNILNDYAYGLHFGAGVIGSPIPGKLNIGLSIVNFGFATGMKDATEKFGEGEDLPVNSRLGVVWMDTLKTIDYRILFDVVYRNVWDRDDDFTHHISDRFTFPFGLEVRPVAPFAIRAGKRINFPTEIINLGMGLNTSIIDFDFGLVVNSLSGDGEADWTASFTYRFVKKDKEKKAISKVLKDEVSKDSESSDVNDSEALQIEVVDSVSLEDIEQKVDANQNQIDDNKEIMLLNSTDETIDTLVDSSATDDEFEENVDNLDIKKDTGSDTTVVENDEENVILESEGFLEESDANVEETAPVDTIITEIEPTSDVPEETVTDSTEN